MTFSDTQIQQLKAKLSCKHVKTRGAGGATLHYVEGWHVIAEANRIFGFNSWDRRTLTTTCVWSGASGKQHAAAYTARVQVRVRAGDVTVVREGSGSGEGKAATPGEAHDVALKSAETDATKRALATFGNPFGLALYDRDHSGVRKPRDARPSRPAGPWTLRSPSNADASFEKPSDFAEALRTLLSGAPDIETLFAIWEQNVDVVRDLNRALKQDHLPKSSLASQLVTHLKSCAITLAKPSGDMRDAGSAPQSRGGSRPKIDKSVLAISEPRRIRCKEHLRYVAGQPCVICGRSPSHAHHVRHAQPRGLALKVSDEFTVPLCAIHHNEVHQTAREKEWWQRRNVEPLAIARALWTESRKPHLPPGTESGTAAALGDAREKEPRRNGSQP